jgi:hypothetical protein
VGGMRFILPCLGRAGLALLVRCLLLTRGVMCAAVAVTYSAAAGLMRPFPTAAAVVVLTAVLTRCLLLVCILTGAAGYMR